MKRNAETAATIEAPAPAEVWTHTGRPQTVPQEAPEEWLDDLLENLGASFDAIVERPIVNPAQDVNDSGESVRSSASPSEPGVAWSFDADNAGGDSGSPKPTPDEERSGAAAEHPEDAKVVQALFYDIASNYLRPYHHFVAALRRGQARGEWIQIARPALENIHRAARDLGIDRLGPLLSSLISLLARLEDEAGAIVKDADGLSILEIHDALVLEAPDAFQIDVAADEGQAFVVHALLSSIPGVGRVTIDRLYRVGLVAVELIVLASPDDLVLTTGIRRDLADQIVQRFRQHQSETAGLSEERVRAAGISELRELLVRLVRTHADYESAAATHAPQAKLKARQARQALLNRTHLILGRLGEAEFASGLEKLSFERRIEELQRFTSHA